MLRQFISAKLSDNPYLIKDDPDFADKLSYQELEEAALATTDDVALRKFRADVWGRKAKQLDRQRYGDKVEVTHKAVPVLNILTVEALVEKVVEAVPESVEVEDASPIDG